MESTICQGCGHDYAPFRYCNNCDYLPPQQQHETPTSAWLIERVNAAGSVLSPAQYLDVNPGFWTTDHLAAIRFCRREDAERVIRLLRGVLAGDGAIATEHMWG